MNLETVALVAKILELGDRAYMQVREIIDRERNGDPLSDAELEALHSESDAAHETIQGWEPGE